MTLNILYDISEELILLDHDLDALLDSPEYDPATGELEQQDRIILALDQRDQAEAEFARRLDGVGYWVRNLEAEAEALAVEIARLKARETSRRNRIALIKAALLALFEMRDLTKVKTAHFTINRQKNGGVLKLLIDQGVSPLEVPEEYQRIDFDNAAIREALEAGNAVTRAQPGPDGKPVQVPFAALAERGQHVRIA